MNISKRLYLTLLCATLCIFLFGCKSQDELHVIVPQGSPSYATLYLRDEDDYDIDVVLGPDPLVAAFGSHTYDVIIAPTNLGAKLYQSSKDYVCAASIVWGNYYLISHQDISIDHLGDKTIYAFGQNQTPDILLQYILSNQFQQSQLEYVSSTTEIITQFLLSPDDVYLIAEPALSQLSDQYSSIIHTIDVQALYTQYSGQQAYPQASVFVKATFDQDTINRIKTDIQLSIDKIHDFDVIEQTSQLLETTLSIESLQQSITHSYLNFVSGIDAKPAIEAYFNIIMQQNPQLIGQTLPEDSFYR